MNHRRPREARTGPWANEGWSNEEDESQAHARHASSDVLVEYGHYEHKTVADQVARLVRIWRDNPDIFAWDVFGIRLWSRQVELVRAVARFTRVAVATGQKVGKSICAAVLAFWWVTCFPEGTVQLTAPTAPQVRNVLWKEVRNLYDRAKKRLAIIGGIGGTVFKLPEIGFKNENDKALILGRATNQPTRMQGSSGPLQLYIVDEVSGMSDAILAAIDGNLQGGGRLVILGNPNHTNGALYDAFHSKKDLYYRIQVSSEETPNFRSRKTVIPGLASYKEIMLRRRVWGRDGKGYESHPEYQVRVLGQFPSSAENQVVTQWLVDRSEERWSAFAGQWLEQHGISIEAYHEDQRTRDRVEELFLDSTEALVLGVDPKRDGADSMVIQARRGSRIFVPEEFTGVMDGPASAGYVLDVVRRYRRGLERVTIIIDRNGLGNSPFDFLCQVADKEMLDIYGVVWGGSARKREDDVPGYRTFRDLRAELMFEVEKRLREDLIMQPYQRRRDDLLAPRYRFGLHNELVVEDKQAIRKRLGKSCDFYDALALALAVNPDTFTPAPDPGYRAMQRRMPRYGANTRGYG